MKKALLLAAVAGILISETPADRAWSILTNALGDLNADRRAAAVHALGVIVNNERARQLAENSLSDPVADVRAAAAESLGQMNANASAEKLFEKMTGDDDTAVVFAAGAALYALDDPRGYGFYYAVLTGQRKTGESLLDSQKKMLQDRKAMEKTGIQAGLGFVPFGNLGYGVVKRVTRDDATPVRAAAAQKLARDPDPRTSEALKWAAADEKANVRAAAITAIAMRGDPKLLSAVTPRLDDENDAVRFAAAAALLRLTK